MEHQGGFYFLGAHFEPGCLIVTLGDCLPEERPRCTITFAFVRTVLFLKDTDFREDFARYEIRKIIDGGERTLGVFEITANAVSAAVLNGRLNDEQPSTYWLSTPDECFEIVSFEAPSVVYFAD